MTELTELRRTTRSVTIAIGILTVACGAGCSLSADGVDSEENQDVTEEAVKAGGETVDIGCMDLSNFNNNTRQLNPGGVDTYKFSICTKPPWPRVGVIASGWSKNIDVVLTDPTGATHGLDSYYTHGGQNWSVAPAMTGSYTATLIAHGSLYYNVSVINDTFPNASP